MSSKKPGSSTPPSRQTADTAMEDYVLVDFQEEMELALKEQRFRLFSIFFPLLLMALIALFVLGYKYHSMSSWYAQQSMQLTQQRKKALALSAEVEQLRNSTETLLQNKIPGLYQFQYNKNIDINNRYLKRIVFDESISISGASEGFQCRISLFNEEPFTIIPNIVLVFFNQDGAVVDYLHLGSSSEAGMQLFGIRPNEKRSDISPLIKTPEPDKKPVYFMVRVN